MMLKFIDDFLNRVTMYRLALYYLVFLLAAALILSAFGLLPFSPPALIFSTAILLAASWLANGVCAKFLGVPANVESVYITALILALIISPPAARLTASLPLLIWASIWSQASKYIINLKNKHLFNPAALAAALTALTLNQSATWWVGTSGMLAFVALGGLLVVRKVQRFGLVLAFLAGVFAVMLALSRGAPLTTIRQSLLNSPIIFFAAIMLTEPLTMPPTRDGRLAYGILTGLLFAPQTHIGSFYFTPELALLAGNAFSYIISPKQRLKLKLKQIRRAGEGIYDFMFQTGRPFKFRPGQYMEWTLGHPDTDSRGNRRYFTLASSPTENDILLGVKFYGQPSSYKRALARLKAGDSIIAGQLAGDFTLPDDPRQKLAFVAGGIGITPFRSMLKYLTDTSQRRDIVLFYSNRYFGELVYQDVLMEAWQKLGMRIIGTLTDSQSAPADWRGYTGYFRPEILAKEIPDFRQRLFYISGSGAMVDGFGTLLKKMGVADSRIKTDFFPGLA